jgi:predicted nucleic acid-binding Zn ribbon protein
MRDEPLKKCPRCKKAGLKRLVGGGAGLIFKGTGFYITDYKKSAAKSEGGGKSDGAPKSDGGSASGGEKSTAKSESKAAK